MTRLLEHTSDPISHHGTWRIMIERDHAMIRWAQPGGGIQCATFSRGFETLHADASIGAVIALTNELHAWIDQCLPVTSPATITPKAVVVSTASRWRRRRRRGQDPARYRSTIGRELAAPRRDPVVLARAIILDCLAERLGRVVVESRQRSNLRHRIDGARRIPRARRPVMMTAVLLVALASSIIATTQAVSSDNVAMAAISTEGGTLDLKVDSSTTLGQDGPAANWGSFSASLLQMKPGDVRFADITLRNPGSLAAGAMVTTTGSDSHADFAAAHCFAFYFRERLAGADVQSIGNGSVLGTAETNAGVVGFHPGTGPSQLYTNGAARSVTTWASGAARSYRLSVRMLDGCLQGGAATAGATGSLTFTFDAVQQ